MLDAVYKLGKLNIEKENLDEIDVLLDNKKIGAVVLVEFIEESDGNLKYNKIFQEDYDSKNKIKYLYKKGSSRGTDVTPSCLITDLEKTFNNKFFKWFENNNDRTNLFGLIYDAILEIKDKLYDDLNNFLKTIKVENNILLSIVINNGNKNNYLNDYIEFQNILKEDSLKKYSKIKGDGVCYLCGEHKEVFGTVSSEIGFKFSTAEKKGNVPGYDSKNQWKLVPICSDCALYLNSGKNFIEKNLEFKDFGLNYYVIPNFLFDTTEGFNKLYTILNPLKNENLNSKQVKTIEYKLSKIVKKLDNFVELKFLFYFKNNNSFDILAYTESVAPSYLNKLYQTQMKIADYNFFHEDNLKKIFNNKHSGTFMDLINKNEKKYPCTTDNWYKKFLKDFISKFSLKMYRNTVVQIISKKKIDYNFLMSRIMDKIKSNWRNEEQYAIKISVLKSLMLLKLLNELKLLKGGNIMDMNGDDIYIDKILNSPSKKATFLLGVLTRKLMNIQYKELGSTPFYNKLWGLSLNQKKIYKLYPMVINKLQEYGAGYMRNLEKEISINLAKSENDWKLNGDETSYYFVLGFTLPDYDKNEKEVDLDE